MDAIIVMTANRNEKDNLIHALEAAQRMITEEYSKPAPDPLVLSKWYQVAAGLFRRLGDAKMAEHYGKLAKAPPRKQEEAPIPNAVPKKKSTDGAEPDNNSNQPPLQNTDKSPTDPAVIADKLERKVRADGNHGRPDFKPDCYLLAALLKDLGRESDAEAFREMAIMARDLRTEPQSHYVILGIIIGVCALFVTFSVAFGTGQYQVAGSILSMGVGLVLTMGVVGYLMAVAGALTSPPAPGKTKVMTTAPLASGSTIEVLSGDLPRGRWDFGTTVMTRASDGTQFRLHECLESVVLLSQSMTKEVDNGKQNLATVAGALGGPLGAAAGYGIGHLAFQSEYLQTVCQIKFTTGRTFIARMDASAYSRLVQIAESKAKISPEADALENTTDTKECPVCAEVIKTRAKKCRYCGELLQ